MSGGGGNSSGGGGSSGAVSYPLYLETVHSRWIDNAGVDTLTNSLANTMEAAIGAAPWLLKTAYDPTGEIATYEAVLAAFRTILSGLSDTGYWNAFYANARATINNAVTIAADVSAFSNILDAEINTKVLPRFRRGMQDINAVNSSAFVIGEAVIEGFRDRDVAKYTSSLLIENTKLIMSGTEHMMTLAARRIGWEEAYVRTFIEAKRIKIVAKKEQTDMDAKIDEDDALWGIEIFQYGANMLAAIGGGTNSPNTKRASANQSMLGGALSGAAAGAMIGSQTGSVYGTLGGAIMGGILGASSSYS